VGVDGVAYVATRAATGVAAMSVDHRALGVGYFNGTWELVDRADRSAEDDRWMVATAMASLVHWREAGGTEENLTIGEWQVAHAASLAGYADVAQAFASAAYDRARAASLPDWIQASTAEGRARAAAAAGDRAAYDRYADEARSLLAGLDDEEDRALIEGQLASIPRP
jgi:hypothetical protein